MVFHKNGLLTKERIKIVIMERIMHLSMSSPTPGSLYTYWGFDIYTCLTPGAVDSSSLLNQNSDFAMIGR